MKPKHTSTFCVQRHPDIWTDGGQCCSTFWDHGQKLYYLFGCKEGFLTEYHQTLKPKDWHLCK